MKIHKSTEPSDGIRPTIHSPNSGNWIYSEDLTKLLDSQSFESTKIPTPLDLLYKWEPTSWSAHFEHAKAPLSVEDKIHDTSQNVPFLSTSTLRIGARLRLSSGQRSIIRERYSMTPTLVVEIVNIKTFDSHPNIIEELTIKSDLHIPDTRKHVLNKFVISDFGDFYQASLDRTAELQEKSSTAKSSDSPKKSTTPKPAKRSLESILSDLL